MNDDRDRDERIVADHPGGAGIRTEVDRTGDDMMEPKPNRSGSGADTGEGEPGQGATTNDPTDWLRSAPD